MSTIGERIKQRRKELGLSQEELAVKLGYKSRSSINKIELNWRNLTQSKIKEIADALDTTPAWIMGWGTKDVVNDAELLADLAVDSEMLSYIRKLRSMTDSQRGRVFGYIDSLLIDN